jgi:sigma54-dependent transcription regulator
VPQLTPEELATMLEQIDAVCRQAQDLSAQIQQKMAESRRGDQQADEARRSDRPRARKRTS